MISRFAILVLIVTSVSFAQETKIKRSDLPPAVEKTITAQSQGATIKGFSREKEKGQTYYEVEMTSNGHSKDVTIDANGNVAEVEEQVDFDSLPAAVKAALQSKAGKGRISKVESLTKHDRIVAYEATELMNGKKREIQVGPDGQSLDHPE